MKIRSLLPFIVTVLLLTVASCSKDDDAPHDPVGTVTLNMLDETNGKTLLGGSGIYIDRGQNFVADNNCLIFVTGKANGLGAVSVKELQNPVDRAAVQYGYGYIACRPGVLTQFPSGKLALPIDRDDVDYLKFYAVAPFTEGDKTVGSVIKYNIYTPETNGLPAFGSTVLKINTIYYNGEEIAIALPTDDFEYKFEDTYNQFVCEKRGKKLFFKIPELQEFGNFALWIRIGGSYTKTYITVQ